MPYWHATVSDGTLALRDNSGLGLFHNSKTNISGLSSVDKCAWTSMSDPRSNGTGTLRFCAIE